MFIYCLTHSDQILYDNNYRGHGSREVKRPPPPVFRAGPVSKYSLPGNTELRRMPSASKNLPLATAWSYNREKNDATW